MTVLKKLKDYLEQNQVFREDELIVFQAGSHVKILRIKYSDYARLVSPKVGDFSVHL